MAGPAWLTARPVAHRGFHDAAAGRIENTLSAAEAAIARGFAIECDLQLTADENAVVFHDDTLDRLTDASGRVDRKSLAEVKAARLNGTDDRIPTLAELLETVSGRVPLVVELKSHWNGDRRLERTVARALAADQGPLAVMSFDPESMRAMAGLAPSVPRGLVADRFTDAEYDDLSAGRRFVLRHLLEVARVGAQFVAYDVQALPASAPLFLRHLGWPLLTWTVRAAADRATAARYADQMIFEGFDPEAA
jgi:glycerophosphoryl diester phosphodiesterase